MRALRVPAAAGPAEQHAEGDEPLLHAVVQVAFDAAALVVDGVHDPGAAGGQLRRSGAAGRPAGWGRGGAGPACAFQAARPPTTPWAARMNRTTPPNPVMTRSNRVVAAEHRHPHSMQRAESGADGGQREHHPAEQAQRPARGEVAQRLLAAVLGVTASVEEAGQPAAFQPRSSQPGARRQRPQHAGRARGQASTGGHAQQGQARGHGVQQLGDGGDRRR